MSSGPSLRVVGLDCTDEPSVFAIAFRSEADWHMIPVVVGSGSGRRGKSVVVGADRRHDVLKRLERGESVEVLGCLHGDVVLVVPILEWFVAADVIRNVLFNNVPIDVFDVGH